MKSIQSRPAVALMMSVLLSFTCATYTSAQGQGADKKAAKQEMKQLNKEANKTDAKAEEVAEHLGRDVVFCILAAHTTGVGTAQELRDKFNATTGLSFGQFVAAVLLADRIDMSLDVIITKLTSGMSIGQITKEAGVNMGEVRSHFGEFRSELARSMTNPPTRNCLQAPTP